MGHGATVIMDDRVRVDSETNTVWSNRKLRESGGSVVLTIPRQVMEAAGFELEDQVSVSAHMADGEIRITPPRTD